MAWGQLSGEFRGDYKLGATTLEWRGTAARATRDEPGLRETIYERPLTAGAGTPFTLDSEGPHPGTSSTSSPTTTSTSPSTGRCPCGLRWGRRREARDRRLRPHPAP